MSAVKLFTERANHQALKALLCASFARVPLEVTLASSYSTPQLLLPTTRLPLFQANEMAKALLSAEYSGALGPAATAAAAAAASEAAAPKYAPAQPQVSLEEEEWLDWEATTLSPALAPLYAQRRLTPEASAALARLEAALASTGGAGIVVGAAGVSFLVDAVMFAAVFPALIEGGVLPAAEAERLPALRAWFADFQSTNEERLGAACESLSVQENGDFLRVPRRYDITPVLDKTFFSTTPIYYVNAVPHIGHVYSTLIVDVLGRYHRVKGEKVFVMTGTDEHGQKIAEAARLNKVTPQEFTDRISGEFRDCFQKMGFNMDYFMRTTKASHYAVVQEIWRRLEAKGDIYLGKYEGWYSVSDESFLTAQNVTDGVDKEGKPCKISLESGHVVTWVEEDNYMFRLSAFRERLLDYYHSNPGCIVPEFRRREVIRQVEKGLPDLSVSRKKESVLNWAIPVPTNPDHCIYVWLDALFNYYTVALTKVLADGSDELTTDYHELDRWPCDAHVVGKDILKFHTIYWPAFLMSAGLPLPKKVVAHGWWTKDHKKISKSLGNAFDPLEKANEYSPDALKYFLLRESNFADDGDYSDVNMVARLNGELADTLGNLVMRCVAPKINVKGEWPAPGAYTDVDAAIIASLRDLPGTADHFYLLPDIQKALISIFEVLRALNGYVTDTAPWRLVKDDPARLDTVLFVIMEGVRVCTTLLQPVMPVKTVEILDALGVPQEQRTGVANFAFGVVKPGTKVPGVPEGHVIFAKAAMPARTN